MRVLSSVLSTDRKAGLAVRKTDVLVRHESPLEFLASREGWRSAAPVMAWLRSSYVGPMQAPASGSGPGITSHWAVSRRLHAR
jgi:hypothetical protein